ncbi:MAG: hypothetical protein ACOY4C_01320 [Pseudomonadota bacterium]
MTEVKLRRVAVPAPGQKMAGVKPRPVAVSATVQKNGRGETPASGSQEEPGEDPAAVD